MTQIMQELCRNEDKGGRTRLDYHDMEVESYKVCSFLATTAIRDTEKKELFCRPVALNKQWPLPRA